MRPFHEHTHLAGLDWAKRHHDVVIVDRTGTVAVQFRFDESAEGWHVFREKLKPFPSMAVAIETSSGPVVDRLFDAGCSVYPVQPLAAKSYRQRKAPSGVKDDRLDAWSLADALRTDGHAWRALRPEDSLTAELRLLCRDEHVLIEQRTAMVNQLQEALHDYYPAALEAFEDWTQPAAWAFVERFPSPEYLQKAGRRPCERFLRSQGLNKGQSLQKRLEIFARATQHAGAVHAVAAKSQLAITLVKMLNLLEERLDFYRQRIQELYDQHPDRDWFGSLPISQEGKTAPRLLAELGTVRECFDSPDALQCHAGTAPVRIQTGHHVKGLVRIRLACNKHLRYAIHWFADLSRARCPWASAYYAQKRSEGHGHASALRCLGKRWLKIIWKLWQTRSAYDPDLHQKNQLKHGSWVLKLIPSAPVQPLVNNYTARGSYFSFSF
jgi:transposase